MKNYILLAIIGETQHDFFRKYCWFSNNGPVSALYQADIIQMILHADTKLECQMKEEKIQMLYDNTESTTVLYPGFGKRFKQECRRCCLEGRPRHAIFRPKTAKRIQSCTDDQMAREIFAVTRSQTSRKTVAMHLCQTWSEDILCIFHLLEFIVVNFYNGGANILIRL